MVKKKGRNSVLTTALIIGASASLMAGWTWHSIPGYEVESGNHVAEKAFYDHRSELMVEVNGEVIRLLSAGDVDNSLQWFQMRTPEGQHLLVGHDFGYGDPIPLTPKDRVTVRGGYEWTESGGIIRHTERDHSLNRLHGWIVHEGKKYD